VAITETLDTLHRLQTIDRAIAAYEDELAKLPRTLAEAERELGGVEAQVAEAQGRVDAILKDRRGLEQEMESMGALVLKFETQKASVKTNEEYHAINGQIAHAKEKASALEDRVLASYDDEEAAVTRVDQIKIKLAEVQRTVAERKNELETKSVEDEARLVELRARRETLVPALEGRTLARYESIRVRKGGQAVVGVENGSCGGCHSTLPPQVVHEVRKRNALMFCEFCGRFLVHPAGA